MINLKKQLCEWSSHVVPECAQNPTCTVLVWAGWVWFPLHLYSAHKTGTCHLCWLNYTVRQVNKIPSVPTASKEYGLIKTILHGLSWLNPSGKGWLSADWDSTSYLLPNAKCTPFKQVCCPLSLHKNKIKIKTAGSSKQNTCRIHQNKEATIKLAGLLQNCKVIHPTTVMTFHSEP